MVHQTLAPSTASASSPFVNANDAATPAPAPCSSSHPSPRGSARPSYANHHSLMDGTMDALKSSAFSPEETAEDAAAANAALVEREGFSIEDLLDMEVFGESDTDSADQEDAPPPPATTAEETDEKSSPGKSQPSSIVTYELPPPPPEMVDLPAHDVEEELEWVSRVIDDSLSEVPPPPQPLAMAAAQAARSPLAHHRLPHDGPYRAVPPAPGPLRTLSTDVLVPVKAKRSKRSPSSAWYVSGASLFSDSTSSSSTATTSSSSSSSASFPSFLLDSPLFSSPDFEGYPQFLQPRRKKSKHSTGGKQKPKKRGRKPKHAPQLTGTAAAAAAASQVTQGDRRCSHCGVQKTPQWRAGPEGAKTLCNACGVRFKSGRLLPEYRPACSPTFVSSIHSNSHRKVLEMRRKKEAGLVATAAPAVASF